MDDEQPTFKCRECGATGLYVEWRYDTVEPCTGYLECQCGKRLEAAAERWYKAKTSHILCVELRDCHYWYHELNHRVIMREMEDLDVEVLCSLCSEKAQEQDWVDTVDDERSYRTNDDFYVRCAGCHREIEFGWTGAERIWPVECSDFDSRRCSPYPRYEEKWRERGWWGKTSDNSS